jgi:hypothetical protein
MDKPNSGNPFRRTIGLADFSAPLMMLLSIVILHPYGLKNVKIRFLPSEPASTAASAQPDPFRHAVNQAMRAAVLTQSAKTVEQWKGVEQHWLAAISFMRAVPDSSDKLAVARQKVVEYGRNLTYAQQKKISLQKAKLVASTHAAPKSSGLAQGQPAKISGTTPLAVGDRVADPILSGQSALPPRNWLKVATGIGNQNFYIDPESLSRNLPYVEFWQRVHSIKSGETMVLQDQLLLVNCQTDRFQIKQVVTYNAGQPKYTQPKTQVKANSDSAQARVISSACGG